MNNEKFSRVKSILKERIPITSWLLEYDSEKAVADLIAGLTVGLTVMPQSLAYAALAGLPTQYGLYSAFMGCFIYAVFGGCKDITIGPTALMSLMTYEQVIHRNPDYAVLLCFLSGCVMLIMAPLRLGILVEFISQPVTVGFTAATSIIIVASQIKGLLGLNFTSEGFLPTIKKVIEHIHETTVGDSVLGLVCIIVLLSLRKLKDLKIGDGLKQTKRQKILAKSLWLLSLSRNALVVVVCSFVGYHLHTTSSNVPFKLTGNVRSGLPPFALPPFSTFDEATNTTTEFKDMVTNLGSSLIIVPIIAVLGNVAIAKAFASGGTLNAAQELLTLGLCNLFGSFVSSMPVTGSFSRSAVNHASGVRTPLGGVYTGVMILLALGVLTPYFYYIPKASLAAVIICAVIFMIEYEVVKPMWQASKKDLFPMTITFLVCLLVGVELGILIGVVANIVILLCQSAKPSLIVEKKETSAGLEYTNIMPKSSVYFPGVDHLRNTLLAAGTANLPIVLDCSMMLGTDFTTATGIYSVQKEFHDRKLLFLFCNANPNLLSVLKPICTANFKHVTQDQLDSCIAEFARLGPSDELSQVTELKDLNDKSHRQVENGKDSEEPLLLKNKTIIVKATNGN